MNAISKIITTILDVLLVPFGDTHHTLGLVWLSLLTGAAAAYAFKITSDARAVRKAKDRFKSYILEMRIYRDDLATVLGAFSGALWSNVFYLRSILKPLLVIIVPIAVVFLQLDERYGRSNLTPGSSTLVTVRLAEGLDPRALDASITPGTGAVLDAPPVRIRETGEIAWRMRIDSTGTHTIAVGETEYALPIVAEPSYRMIGHRRSSSKFFDSIVHPALPPIPGGSHIESVRVWYPSASYPLLLWNVHWIVIFIVYSLISAAAVKLLLGFEI